MTTPRRPDTAFSTILARLAPPMRAVFLSPNSARSSLRAKNTGELARLQRRSDGNGAPVRATDPTQPIEVRAVA